MSNAGLRLWMGLTVPVLTSCVPVQTELTALPVDTRFAFINSSTRYYAALSLRSHTDGDTPAPFARTSLVPPGGIIRAEFAEFIGDACPAALDFQLFLYRRINDGKEPPVPIGLDEGEQVEATPIVAGQIDNLPGSCGGYDPVGVYTIVSWEAPAGSARVKFAQDTDVDAIIRQSGRFNNRDAAWELTGVDPALAEVAPPAPMPKDRVAGRVVLANGTGVEGVGVLLRTRFRVRLDDANFDNDPDAGFSDPIAYVLTDAAGAFAFDRPAGLYQVEFFSDEFAFAPFTVEVESPIETIEILAESF